MRNALSALAVAAVILAATPAYAGDCYSWQIMTCGDDTQVIRDKHRATVGYLERQSDGEIQILGKDRSIKGYIENGKILGKDRRQDFAIEGLPERYNPIVD